MKNLFKFKDKNKIHAKLFAFLFFCLGLLFTVFHVYFLKSDIKKTNQNDLYLLSHDISSRIEIRLSAQGQLLRSASSLFAASDFVSREEWRKFYERENIEKNLPGIQGMGYSIIIPKYKLNAHIKSMQEEGFANYSIHPDYKRDIYTSIIFLEPFSGRNLKAFAYDMFTEAIRRKAMEQSRDEDKAILSGKVRLIQEDNENIQAGTLMYVPVYEKNSKINTIEERRQAIKGWVYSPYRMNDMMKGILGIWESKIDKRIHLQIYENNQINEKSKLYDSQENDLLSKNLDDSYKVHLNLNYNGKIWNLVFSQSYNYNYLLDSRILLSLFSGLAISSLLYFLLISLINTNIKANKIAEDLTKTLRENELRLKTIIDNEPECIKLVDKDGKVLQMNPAGLEMIEADNFEQVQNKFVIDVIDNEFKDQYHLMHSKVISGSIEKMTYKVKGLKGGSKWLETHAVPFEYNNEIVQLAVTRDISDRKLVENKINELNRDFVFFLENTSDYISYKDKNGKIRFCSQALANLTGFESWQEMIGKTDKEIYPEDIAQKIKNEDDEILIDRKEILNKVESIQNLSGNLIWISTNKWPQLDSESNVVGFFSISHDISTLIETQKKLADNERFLFQLVENNGALIYAKDKDGYYLLINKKWEEITGLSKERVIGKHDKELFPENIANAFIANDKKIMADKLVIEFEEILELPNEIKYFISIKFPMFDSNNNVSGICGISTEISERKKAQEIIQQKNDELAEINASKDKLFSIIAHDLKSPFSGFIGLTKMMSENIHDFTYEEIQEYSLSMFESSSNLYGLLENLLDWSRIQRRLIEYNPVFCSLFDQIQTCIKLQNETAKQKNITIINNIDSKIHVYIDTAMFNTVIRNLISNSIKFSNPYNQIEIANIHSENNRLVKIYVKDYGIGMSDEIKNNLFKIDQKNSRKGTSNEASTGLGLLLCKEFITQIGGEISFESVENEGTTFYLSLPKLK